MSSLAYRRANFKRACDDCGHEWPFSKLKYIGLNRWVCPDDKKMLTREQYARHMAKPIPTIFGPRKHPKTSGSIGTYQTQEAEHLNICARFGVSAFRLNPNRESIELSPATAGSVAGIAESLRYLATMVEENKRPPEWLETARAAVVQQANALLAFQFGSLEGWSPSAASNTITYGSFSAGGSVSFVGESAVAGIGLLKAYSITGQKKYLDAATRTGTFIRNTQRCDRLTPRFTASSSGGSTPLFLGGWPNFVQATGAFTSTFSVADAVCLWFLSELKDVLGGSTEIGATAGNNVATSTVGTIDTAISEAQTFYLTASYASAAPISTSPKSYLSAFLNVSSGDGAWHLDSSPETNIDGLAFAYGLRGAYEAEGYSSRIAAVVSWLRAFTSNTAFHPSGNETRAALENTNNGTFDPTFAMAETIKVTTQTNGTSEYDLAATGLMAPLTIAAGGSLRAVKDELVRAKRIVSGPRGRDESVTIGPLALMGLTYQVHTQFVDLLTVQPNLCALTGEMYRHQPQSWSGLL